ncbi:DoxX family protein [Bdellovibrio sp. HCB-162]|uniref:DoxX family protein n=1 Tax=Bdellovibrio sp. HCB-162 TaxID=3394234 RepID=UPI0039BCD9CF
MNIFLWVLQVLLALHTAVGAVWKFSHSAEQTMPSLKAIPSGVWMGMAILELICSVLLILPVLNKSWGISTSVGAIIIAAEMLLFCGLHLVSGEENFGPMVYWLVVAAICAFIAYGRLVLKPF